MGAMPFRASVSTSSQVAMLISPTWSAVQVAGKTRIMMNLQCMPVEGEYASIIGRVLSSNYRRAIRRDVGKHLVSLSERMWNALVPLLR